MKLFAQENIVGFINPNSKTLYGNVMKINTAEKSCCSFLKIENNIFQINISPISSP